MSYSCPKIIPFIPLDVYKQETSESFNESSRLVCKMMFTASLRRPSPAKIAVASPNCL